MWVVDGVVPSRGDFMLWLVDNIVSSIFYILSFIALLCCCILTSIILITFSIAFANCNGPTGCSRDASLLFIGAWTIGP